MEAKVTIRGMSPLLMKRYPLEPIEGLEKKPKEEQAELAAYRIPKTGELYIPGDAIQRALINGAAYSKGRGRASLQKVSAACILVSQEFVGLGTNKYEIDSRPVVVPATRGRILRHRPRIDRWKAQFNVEWDETLVNEVQVKRIIEDTGKLVGLLEFRPACKGRFGRFELAKWEKSK